MKCTAPVAFGNVLVAFGGVLVAVVIVLLILFVVVVDAVLFFTLTTSLPIGHQGQRRGLER